MEQQVMARAQEWAEAERHGDSDALARILADDFGFVGPLGFMLTKAQWRARYTAGDLHYTDFAWEPAQVRLFGDTAIATGRVIQAGTLKGERDIAGQFRATQVFVRQDGQWLLAALHFSPIAAPPVGA